MFMTAPAGRSPFTPFGFETWMGHPPPMERPHRHNEVELNFLWEGQATYLTGGNLLELPMRRLCVFWGAVPHHIVKLDRDCRLSWMTLPLSWVLRWGLPKSFIEPLLHGRWLMDRDNHTLDEVLLPKWLDDRNHNRVAWDKVVVLEAEARLRRLALLGDYEHSAFDDETAEGAILVVEKVARHVAEHFDESLTAAEIAEAVGRHPNYLMQVFKQYCGVSIGEYIMDMRISNAQRLLATTKRKVADIAVDSGFPSLSRFYEAFSKYTGMAPGAYRAANRVSAPADRYQS
jgi:AraC-like DNA-binding protein